MITQSPDAPRKQQAEWSIGIYMGKSPFDFSPAENIDNPVLTRKDVSDIQAAFVADPFMLKVDGIWHMFFEVLNQQTRKGEIGLAISNNGVKWTYRQIVLAEPFHLSYPYVFEWLNEYYMIPETQKANSIRLYKAAPFPTQWTFIGTLLRGPYYVDASICRHGNKWWLFTETNPNVKHDTLRLYYADDMMGPWREHPKSPIIQGNGHIARPAGRVLAINDRVVRYTQDCHPIYGTKVRAFEITTLTTTDYHEQENRHASILAADGIGWNASGMHHIDPHFIDAGQWVACVDGWFNAEFPSRRK